MDLNGLVLFVEIIKQGSITRAGMVLGKPKSTLSRQLSEFEQTLGVKLVEYEKMIKMASSSDLRF